MKGLIRDCDLQPCWKNCLKGPAVHTLVCVKGYAAAANPFDLCSVCDTCDDALRWRDFWDRLEREWAEQFKKVSVYDAYFTAWMDQEQDPAGCPYCGINGCCDCTDSEGGCGPDDGEAGF